MATVGFNDTKNEFKPLLTRIRKDLTEDLGRIPSESEIVKAVLREGLTRREVKRLLK